jgi:hypothetical protein
MAKTTMPWTRIPAESICLKKAEVKCRVINGRKQINYLSADEESNE